MNTNRVFLKQPCLDLSATILPMRPLPRSILALTATLLFTAFAVPVSHSQQFLSGSSISFKDSEGYQVSLFLPEGVMEQQVMQNRILWNRALPINFKNHGLHNYRARTIYYEEILKELIMQPVVGSFYFLDELFAETPNPVFDKDIRAKWIMLMFILGEAGETVNPFEESILQFDERYIGSTLKTLSRGFDFAEFYKLNPQLDAFLSRMNLPFNTEQAVKAIEEIEVARTVLTVRREINTIAKTMTLIAAMNMDNALRKLEDLRVLNNTLNDPAFEQALENTYLVFENMNQDFWATMFFSLRESLDEISNIGEAIITITPAFKAAKKKITAKLTAAGFNTPTLFAFYFT